jgi:hypothetical protein
VPPSLLQESQARRAAMMLPACMRPEGVGAKRPRVTFSSMSLLPVQMLDLACLRYAFCAQVQLFVVSFGMKI